MSNTNTATSQIVLLYWLHYTCMLKFSFYLSYQTLKLQWNESRLLVLPRTSCVSFISNFLCLGYLVIGSFHTGPVPQLPTWRTRNNNPGCPSPRVIAFATANKSSLFLVFYHLWPVSSKVSNRAMWFIGFWALSLQGDNPWQNQNECSLKWI
jgi:hypothetical protein